MTDCEHLDDDPLIVLVTVGDDEATACRWCAGAMIEQALDDGVDAAEITVELIKRSDVA
jgi:hypothetical protein